MVKYRESDFILIKCMIVIVVFFRVHLHDTTVVYDCSFSCIRYNHDSLQDQLQHQQANSNKELCFYDIIAYAKVKNRIRQSYRVDRP